MASQPPKAGLPVFYKDLVPLNSKDHSSWKSRPMQDGTFLANQHAIPATVDEFPILQRYYPIIFTSGNDPVPLVLMGMNEGINVYVDEEGKLRNPVYVPAYIRRYPFMLARLSKDAKELSLCFDPQAGAVGDFDEGEPLFDGDQPSETTKAILDFCEQFEQSWQKTMAFIAELKKYELLMEGELKVENPTLAKPFVYRGFQMVNEEKLRELRGDELRKLNQNGMLPLIHAHLYSLQIMRELFAEQARQGKLPEGAVLQPGADSKNFEEAAQKS